MRLRSLTTFAFAATALLAISGCSTDSVSEPRSNMAPADTASSLLGLGGTIVLPGAGLTIVVPPLAVGKTTEFKITARKGSYLAYDMQPHGTKFLLPLVATQNLTATNARGLLNLNLSLGYYPDPTKVTTVTEIFGVQLDLLKLTAISTIPHFSGYIFASGRENNSSEEQF